MSSTSWEVVEKYDHSILLWLAQSTAFIFEVGRKLKAPRILCGLLGGGAFRGDRPLTLLLHLLLEPEEAAIPMEFHYPVFWQYGRVGTEELEQAILERADEMLERLRRSKAANKTEAISEILKWNLPFSHEDKDLAGPFFPQEDTASQSPLLPDTGPMMGGWEGIPLTSDERLELREGRQQRQMMQIWVEKHRRQTP